MLFILFSKVILKRICAPMIMCYHYCIEGFTSKCKHSDGVTVNNGPVITEEEDVLLSSTSLNSQQYGSHLNRSESRNSINT